MLQSRLDNILVEVYKSLISEPSNPLYIRDLLKIKNVPYNMRDCNIIDQPKKWTTKFGLRSFSYLEGKLWNDLPSHLKDLSKNDINDFRCRLKHRKGLDTANIPNFYV